MLTRASSWVFLDTSINGDTLFIIYLEGETNSDGTQQYSYLISNLGEVSIRDLVDGDELPYVTSDGNPFVVSRQQTSAF